MELTQTSNGTQLTFIVSGRLDTLSAPQFQKAVQDLPQDVTELVVDMAAVDYISSAGLRVFAFAGMKLKKQNGKLTVKNMNPTVQNVFDMTGFTQLLDI